MEDMASSPIGIFDSGIGGVTVLREIINLLPNGKNLFILVIQKIIHMVISKIMK